MSVTGPDKDGYIYEIFHRTNKNGIREKVTRKYQSNKNEPDTEAFLFKLRRKHRIIKPFGRATNNDGCTIFSTEDVYITDPNLEEKDDTVAILKNNMAKVRMKHLNKREHLNKRDLILPMAEPKSRRYKPPMISNNIPDELVTQLRVSNLTKDAEELDLRELFGSFGRITRVFIAKEYTTRESRGFGFVTFGDRQDAESALENLNGHGYGYLILKVEWAKPRKTKERTYYSGYGKALPQTSKK
tara:strand:- start:1013 stop:1741 length:729 start_codon:yes stop_codon:yes gene_type:complete